MKILLIANWPHTSIGGIESYNRLIYELFPENDFIEIITTKPYAMNNISNRCNNVESIDLSHGFINYINESNITHKKNCITNFIWRVITISKNRRFISNELEKIIINMKPDIIIYESTYFYLPKILKKYKNIIYFVQHEIPYLYFENYHLDNKKNKFVKNTIKENLKNICLKNRPPFLKKIKNLVVFDEKNEVFFKKYRNIKKIYKINLSSKYEPGTTNYDKKYEYGFASRLCDKKNISGIIHFIESNPDKKIIIAGEGPSSLEFKKYKNVDFMGPLNFEGMKNLYNKTKYFVLLSHYEGFPNTILESFSFGVPCIVANTFPSAEYLIGNNNRGLLIDLNEDWIYEINKFVEENDYNKMSEECLNFSRENLTKDKFKLKWEEIFSIHK